MTDASDTPTTGDDAADQRAAQRSAWARQATGDAECNLQRASVDAGFRSYWRGRMQGDNVIVMDSPPDLQDVRPWLHMRDLLEGGGLRVPAVIDSDIARGFLLLEDFGEKTCLQIIDTDNADAMVDAALSQLLALQRIAPPADLPEYDAAFLQREMRLFDEWFLGTHLGVALDADEQRALAGVRDALVDAALAQGRLLVHRDFMFRNLMPVAGGVGVLDFQDAVRGPLAYDVMSLFKDAFVSWGAADIKRWVDDYHRRALEAGIEVPDRDHLQRDIDLLGVQRHLKILGIFARLHHRDAKPRYLEDAPRFLRYIADVVPDYPQLAPLRRILEDHVFPRLKPLPTAG